jgi:similar to spore coat protein
MYTHKSRFSGEPSSVEEKREVIYMTQPGLAPHESMEIHEMLNFKTICLTKSKMMQGLVFDKDLKALMQKDVQQSIQAMNQLQSLYAKMPIQ